MSTKSTNNRFAMILCFLISVLEGYDLQLISSAGPYLKRQFDLAPEQIGFFFSSSLIGLAIGAVIGGRMADIFGRKPLLIASVVILGLFTFLTAFATSYESIIMYRILAGIGLGGAMPTVISLVAELAGGKNTTSAVTTIIIGQPTGGIISALTGSTIASQYGWASLFLIGGLLTLLIIPLMIIGLPETKPAKDIKAKSPAKAMPTMKTLFGEGRASGTILLWIIFIFTLAILSVLLSWTPLLVMGKGFSRTIGINTIIAVNVGGIVGGLFISRLIDRVGLRWPMTSLYALMAVSLFLFAGVQTLGPLIIIAFLAGFAVLGAQFTLYGISPQLYPISGRSSGVGIAVAMGRVGSILGPLVIGGALSIGKQSSEALLYMAPIAVIAGIALIALTYVAKFETTQQKPNA